MKKFFFSLSTGTPRRWRWRWRWIFVVFFVVVRRPGLFIYLFVFVCTAADVRTEMDEDEDNVQDNSRTRDRRTAAHAQYVSVNCVVFTHYTGDVASVVDEHFSRALNSDQKLNNAHQTSAKGEPRAKPFRFRSV